MPARIAALFLAATMLTASCAVSIPRTTVRFATFNIAMGLDGEGQLYRRLERGDDPNLVRIAEILQRVRPDVLLLNEFDHRPGSARLLVENYLQISQSGQKALHYRYAFSAPVNTGEDSGMDLNGNGRTGDPEDAWGYGRFPGQYGMLVLSRFPIETGRVRTFRQFLWKDMPGALRPRTPTGESFYPDETWAQLRLSSKSHWDLPLTVQRRKLHLLVSHPTPTVFDGPEDRNGRRNHDENRLWADFITPGSAGYLVDDDGNGGGLPAGSSFVIAGDLNADPVDGGWQVDSMGQLLNHPRINAGCVPRSAGSAEASERQGGANLGHRGDPAADTSDFNDDSAGNYRIDYVLPSANLEVAGCGVFWPAQGEPGHDLVGASDHRLVWVDILL